MISVLEEMAAKASRSHRVEGDLALAGLLGEAELRGTFNLGIGRYEPKGGISATVLCSESATIQWGAFNIRTVIGTSAKGRTKTDQYAYVPFMAGNRHNACVLEIKHIVLVRRADMGWPNGEARLAVGTLWDHLSIRRGAGLEDRFNDDPNAGACCVPRALWLSPRRRRLGYSHAVHLRQIHCPCVFIPDEVKGDYFITISKMGFNGRRDLLYEAACGQSHEEDDAGGDTSVHM